MMYTLYRCILITALTLFVSSSLFAQAQLVIDDFDAGNSLIQTTVGTNSQTTSDAGILGGTRFDSIGLRSLGGNEFLGSHGFNGNWVVTQGSLDQIFGGVEYTNLGGFDFIAGGFDAFEIDFTSADSTLPINDLIDLTVVSGGGTAVETVSVPGSDALGAVQIDFSDFLGVDFADVDSIALDFDFLGNEGRDFQIGSFGVVGPGVTAAIPEPSSFTIFGMVVAGAIARRRRS